MSDRSEFERYQAFMVGYVNRINKATLNVTIGGVRIGTAKQSRLAQINLHTRIITFSKFAIENVPERGRRYLVLHELAHVKEASHNKRFWDIVAGHEPNYKQIGHALDLAFKRNVREYQQQISKLKVPNALSGRLEEPKLLLSSRLMNYKLTTNDQVQTSFQPEELDEEASADSYECMEDEFDMWNNPAGGVIQGGSDFDTDTVLSGVQLVPSAI